MRFLIDAHLTHLICDVLHQKNHNAIHVKQLPEGDDTSDQIIIEFADMENRVVVTKDSDFYYSHILTGKPRKLLLIKTGNIKNKELLTLIRAKISLIELLFETIIFLNLMLMELSFVKAKSNTKIFLTEQDFFYRRNDKDSRKLIAKS